MGNSRKAGLKMEQASQKMESKMGPCSQVCNSQAYILQKIANVHLYFMLFLHNQTDYDFVNIILGTF